MLHQLIRDSIRVISTQKENRTYYKNKIVLFKFLIKYLDFTYPKSTYYRRLAFSRVGCRSGSSVTITSVATKLIGGFGI